MDAIIVRTTPLAGRSEDPAACAPSPVRAALRLLVVDEAQAGGGLARVGRASVPRLAAQCERVVWCLPDHLLPSVRAEVGEHERLEWAGFNWPKGRAENVLGAILRRANRVLGRMGLPVPESLWCWLEQRRLRALVREHEIDVVYYAALFTQPFPELDVPVCALVADVNYDARWRDECLRQLALWSRKAAALVAISEFTRVEIARRCPEAIPRLHAVPLAVDRGEGRPAAAMAARRGGLSVYYPATVNAHKRHRSLLEAMRLLHERGVDIGLTFTGGGTDQLVSSSAVTDAVVEAARIFLASSAVDFRARVRALGYVAATEVERCYAEADVVALPSSYEGFGLPLSEAVIRGKRVVCADIPAFREQVQLYGLDDDVVTFVTEATPEAWAVALEAAGRAARLPGQEVTAFRFERWTWTDVAKAQIRIFTEAKARHDKSD